MAENKKLYTEDSIESLSPLEFTRLRPQVYAGDCTYSTQLLVEILSNAIDEYNLGHGSSIEVKIDKDVVIVEDHGQGFIVNHKRDDGKTILEAAFSVLNTSGKYREDGTYEGTSLGSFGIGSKITTFLSHWLDVATCRDNQVEFIHFSEGEFATRMKSALEAFPNTKQTGTFVRWEPSEQFFTHPEVEIEKVKSLFETITCLCPGLTINLDDNGKKTVYHSTRGLNDLADKMVKDKEIINNRFSMNFSEGKEKMDFILTYTSNYSMTMVPYVNTGLTEKGPHITQIKTVLTREFNKFFKDKKWLKSTDENLSGDDLQEGMYIVFNITAPNVSYDAQVKSNITKIGMTTFTQALVENLNLWLESNEKEIKTIADKAINAKKAREAAKKARETARGDKKEKKNKLLNLPTKLVDANSKKRLECELFIAEGDSAAGGLIKVRNSETQGIFPIRGKLINLYKNSPEKVLANAEVNNLKKALGLDIDVKTGKLIYDTSKLRYGKILTACDADPDGMAIKNLILTCLWTICPELILNGHVYVTTPPLYRITKGKDKYIYIKDDEELEQYKNEHRNEKLVINRNKGLGEQDSEELEPCLLNPETRNISQIIVPDKKQADIMFETLMGTSVPPRRAWLLAHSEDASEGLW